MATTSSNKHNKQYVPQYTLTKYSRGVPRYPSIEATSQSSIQVYATDVQNLDVIPTTSNTIASKNNVLYLRRSIVGAQVLICLLGTAVVVPILINFHSSNDMTTTTTISTTPSTSTTASTTSSTSTTTSTTSSTSTKTSTTSSTSTTTSTTSSTSTTTSTTTTQNPYACGNMTVLNGYDLPGADITSSTLANYTLCCTWCRSYTGCVAYTWGLSTAGSAANVCFLKNGVPTSVANAAFVSVHL